MPADVERQYLLCYDIREPGRLTRVHRYLTSVAIPLQSCVIS